VTGANMLTRSTNWWDSLQLRSCPTLRGQGHQQRAVRHRVRDTELQVDRTRLEGRRHHPRRAGHPPVHFGHERRRLLVPGEHIADAGTLHWLVSRMFSSAGIPEDHRDLIFQASHQQLRRTTTPVLPAPTHPRRSPHSTTAAGPHHPFVERIAQCYSPRRICRGRCKRQYPREGHDHLQPGCACSKPTAALQPGHDMPLRIAAQLVTPASARRVTYTGKPAADPVSDVGLG
jgi:hypothetical protein